MKSRFGKIAGVGFILVETVCCLLNMTEAVTCLNQIRYTSIVLCFLFAVTAFFVMQKEKQKDCKEFRWVVAGLFFTCIADYFLVLLGSYFATGVFFFMLTQSCYFGYLLFGFPNRIKRKQLSIRCICIALSFIAISIVLKQMSLLVLLLSYYAVFFIGNIALAIMHLPQKRLFTIGLLLFICCDICVALSNAGVVFSDVKGSEVANYLIWIFYMPSQVCIASSIVLVEKTT